MSIDGLDITTLEIDVGGYQQEGPTVVGTAMWVLISVKETH